MTSMCQGQCSAEICSKTLRCGERVSLNRSEVIEEHTYCKYGFDSVQRNKIFDIIDRSDEVIENTLTVTNARIDYSYLTNCTPRFEWPQGGYWPGVTCHQSSNKTEYEDEDCRDIWNWCRADQKDSCIVNADRAKISTQDKTLCGNTTYWKYVPTDYYDYYNSDVEIRGYGQRCSGSSQHIIFTWYNWYDGEPIFGLKQNCEDYSDQVYSALSLFQKISKTF